MTNDLMTSDLTTLRHVMNLRDLGEFGLIRRIRERMTPTDPALIRGIGDDVAVVDRGRKALLVTTDILIEDIHFERTWTDPALLAKKSLVVNLSDIAAMGGTPKYFLISLGLPQGLSWSFIASFYRGLKQAASQFHVDLIGGDTSLSRRIVINICLLGEGTKKKLLYRNGARVGDLIFVSGTLGDAALGLKFLQRGGGKAGPKRLMSKHLLPVPRIELGHALAEKGWATSMIDVSDGLLIDASHLLEESHVGGLIREDQVPLSRLYRKWIGSFARDPYQFAMSGGEDYELLFTAPARHREKILQLGSSLKVPVSCVGEIRPRREGFHILGKKGRISSPRRLGFEHFMKR